jgi:hypothetical protein
MVLGERHTAEGLLLSPAGVDYCEFVQTSYSTHHHTTHIDSDPRVDCPHQSCQENSRVGVNCSLTVDC